MPTFLPPSKNRLGDALRTLMDRRSVTCTRVLVVVSYQNAQTQAIAAHFAVAGDAVLTPGELINHLKASA